MTEQQNAQTFIDGMIRHPVIAAVRSESQLQLALKSPVRTVFLLAGSINDLASSGQRIQSSGRDVFLHLDLIAGLKPDAAGLKFIARTLRPTGIITTRPAAIRWAKEEGLLTVQRVFLLDSTALSDGRRHIRQSRPDLVEVLPGVSDAAIAMAAQAFQLPLIAGGLVRHKDEVMAALAAGALAVSTGQQHLWHLA